MPVRLWPQFTGALCNVRWWYVCPRLALDMKGSGMARIEFTGTDNPDGILDLVSRLPSDFVDAQYEVVFPAGYLYTSPFPVLAAWAKRAPDGTQIRIDLRACQEAARRLVENVGLRDIVELDLESPRRIFKNQANVPLQPIVVGRSTEEVLDKVYHMVDDWAGYQRDTSAFKTILSELAENVLVHSEAATPGYVSARVHRSSQGEKCEIAFADSGIGIKSSYMEGTNEDVKERIRNGASAVQVAVDGLNSSKPKECSPGGRSHFGYGLFTVKRLIELNRGRMTVISGDEFLTLNRYQQNVGCLTRPWHGTIIALVIDLANPLPLEDVYEEEVARLVPGPAQQLQAPMPMPVASKTSSASDAVVRAQSRSEPIEKQTLTVKDFSTKLLARETGLAIRAELATLLVDGAVVEVDLDGVDDITPSVADECFGKLAARMGDHKYRTRVILRGGVPLLHRLIDFVVANRLKGQAAALAAESEKSTG